VKAVTAFELTEQRFLQGRAWVAAAIGARAEELTFERLKGSTSSSVYLVQAGEDEARRFVLRVIDNPQWLAEEPRLVDDEAAALQEAERAGLRAPRLVAISSDDVGFGAPVILMTFLRGQIDILPSNFDTWLDKLARELAHIHSHKAESLAKKFWSWVRRDELRPPLWSSNPETWARAIAFWKRGAPEEELVFLHRDYHPTNVLWENGEISGVVDWVNGCCGPRGVDVAHCRTNLAMMHGGEMADLFLEKYQRHVPGYAHQPHWDIDSVLDMCLPQPTLYEPWKEFGLGLIGQKELEGRVEGYLRTVVGQR
jgi:aminoglycoside phosphotransferase (APT) family kinase protein